MTERVKFRNKEHFALIQSDRLSLNSHLLIMQNKGVTYTIYLMFSLSKLLWKSCQAESDYMWRPVPEVKHLRCAWVFNQFQLEYSQQFNMNCGIHNALSHKSWHFQSQYPYNLLNYIHLFLVFHCHVSFSAILAFLFLYSLSF